MNIEPLEARISPAAVVTFTDVDGDLVTVKTSKGATADLAAILTLVTEGLGKRLQEIDFSLNGAVFTGTNLSVTAKRTGVGGDGLVNVGYIDASTGNGGAALDLGLISIRGDLGRIDAGDANTATAAVKGLSVQSMGQFGTSTQGSGTLGTNISGALGFLKVAGNVKEVVFRVGSVGSVTIGGSLVGGTGGGEILSDGAIGPVKIGGNIEGSSSSPFDQGSIFAGGTLASVTVGGSLIGGADTFTGSIQSYGAMGPVKIGGDVMGGSSAFTGSISSRSKIASVAVGGSLLAAGSIYSDHAVGSVTIGGSIIAGTIKAGDSLGQVTVKGSLIGTSTAPVLITARGQATPGLGVDVAIKGLSVGGRVEFTDILAGYNTNFPSTALNADAQIGPVVIGGDWIASNLVAGVQDDGSPVRNAFFGDANDLKIAGGSAGIVSKIASILIKGTALGTVGGTDHFGFVAQQIGSFKIGATAFPLTAGAANDNAGLPVGITGDLRVREVAL